MRYRLTIAVGIVIAAATALSGQPVYRLHDNGELWVAKAGICSGQPCVKWHLLDNNPNTREITAGGDAPGGFDPLKASDPIKTPLDVPLAAPPLYQRHADGKIWRYTGTPCSGGSCPGWELLDNNQETVSIVAAGRHLYQRHKDGKIWRYKGGPCNGTSCPGWQLLDNNQDTAEITAGGIPAQTELYQRHKNGKIWRYTGEPCNGTSCLGWQLLDNNTKTQEITATVRMRSNGVPVQALYQRHIDGKIWFYTGTPCKDGLCPGWQLVGDHPDTISIVTATEYLYQLRKDGSILIYPHTTCSGVSCWQLLDNNPRTRQIAAGTVSLYQRHDNGAIWRYTGPPCKPDRSCPGWQLFYDPTTWTIASSQN